ncbi:MAG: FAD-dependent oxidoreductase [Rhodoblastus sp.]
MAIRADVIVLGAGMVGVGAAAALQARGRDVALVDRRGAAGRETSYGNAGLIERASVELYTFPRDLGTILRTIFGANPAARIDWAALPQTLPWIARYFLESAPARAAAHARAALPLIERCLDEHMKLAHAAGAADLIRPSGWIKAFRTEKTLAEGAADARRIREYGLTFDALDAPALAKIEPGLAGFVGAILLRDPAACIDPGGLTAAYAGLFARNGGQAVFGRCAQPLPDAAWLERGDGGRRRRRARGGRCARAVVGRRLSPARLPDSARGEARLSHALPPDRRGLR